MEKMIRLEIKCVDGMLLQSEGAMRETQRESKYGEWYMRNLGQSELSIITVRCYYAEFDLNGLEFLLNK